MNLEKWIIKKNKTTTTKKTNLSVSFLYLDSSFPGRYVHSKTGGIGIKIIVAPPRESTDYTFSILFLHDFFRYACCSHMPKNTKAI